MSRLTLSVLGTLSLLGSWSCNAGAPAAVGPEGESPRPAPGESAVTATSSAGTDPSSTEGASASAGVTNATSPPRTAPFTAERLHDHPVTSIAIGKAPKLATFGVEPFLFDAHGWRLRPLPALDAGSTLASATIYYGRDNQPRLMGTVVRGETKEPLYLRHVPAGFREEPSEIATLASTPGGLYGVLGYEDPEVVCAPGAYCLVKSVRGWNRMPAATEAETLFMTSEGVHAVRGGRVFVLEGTDWKPIAELDAGVTADVTGICYETTKRTWLVGGGAVLLRDVDAGANFVEQAGVSTRAHAVGCEQPGSVWVVGEEGAVHFDGSGWLGVDAATGPLVAVAKGHDAMLVGGVEGLFALRKRQ